MEGASEEDVIPYMQLANLRNGTIDYRKPIELTQEGFMQGAVAAAQISNASLKSRAPKDLDAAIDLGLRSVQAGEIHQLALNRRLRRYASGYKCPTSIADASTLWFGVLNNSKATPAQLARAHTCIATVAMHTQDGVVMRRVLMHVDTAASLDYISPTALILARRIPSTLLSQWPNLKRAADKRQAEMTAENQVERARMSTSPMRYACAAQGCGIRATSGKALKTCGGKCELPYKPSYCSADCQRAVSSNGLH